MKRMLLPSFAILTFLAFTACTKTETCECKITDSNGTDHGTQSQEFTGTTETNKTACDALNRSYTQDVNGTSVTFTTTCAIK